VTKIPFAVRSLIVGWSGGVASTLVCHPLDTLKVRVQNRDPINMRLFRNPYKGLFYPLLTRPSTSALSVLGFEWGKAGWEKVGLDPKARVKRAYVAGLFAGVVDSLVRTPVDRCKVQAQFFRLSTVATFLKLYKEPFHILSTFLHGYILTLMWRMAQCSLFFGFYEQLRGYGGSDIVSTCMKGGTTGMVSWTIIMPIDTVRCRYFALQTGSQGILRTAKDVVEENGLRGFYRGYWTILIRAFPASAAWWGASSQSRQWLLPEPELA